MGSWRTEFSPTCPGPEPCEVRAFFLPAPWPVRGPCAARHHGGRRPNPGRLGRPHPAPLNCATWPMHGPLHRPNRHTEMPPLRQLTAAPPRQSCRCGAHEHRHATGRGFDEVLPPQGRKTAAQQGRMGQTKVQRHLSQRVPQPDISRHRTTRTPLAAAFHRITGRRKQGLPPRQTAGDGVAPPTTALHLLSF